MNCWTTFFSRVGLAALTAVLLAGCLLPSPTAGVPAGGECLLAVLPPENLSAASAPLVELQSAYADELRRQGLAVLPEAELAAFMARHRLRHTGSIDAATAQAFRDELGVTGIVITSLELYQAGPPPKIALHSRLVQSGSAPRITWIDGIGLSGDAAPGLLDLGLVHAIEPLREKALAVLAGGLAQRLAGGAEDGTRAAAIAPAVWYRAAELATNPPRRIAVLPFVNQSDRRHAGDLMHLHSVRQLVAAGKFEVIEPGVVRDALMQYRVILPEGASHDIAALLFEKLDADLLFSGKVIAYEDYQGGDGAPAVSFNAQGLARRRNEIVWASESHRRDDQGSIFFALGKVHTAHDLAARMLREIALRLAGGKE